ncbi:hypothetical protein RRG08_066407 [Elysia crispata]|uniref:Uncharacterized protein n=1 Tax=Elysia crispata TaxID=231223 RepID=A0AAE1E7F5_9GAST|nr:hypothetical protein RRG08_066407 [Elysia crispata]
MDTPKLLQVWPTVYCTQLLKEHGHTKIAASLADRILYATLKKSKDTAKLLQVLPAVCCTQLWKRARTQQICFPFGSPYVVRNFGKEQGHSKIVARLAHRMLYATLEKRKDAAKLLHVWLTVCYTQLWKRERTQQNCCKFDRPYIVRNFEKEQGHSKSFASFAGRMLYATFEGGKDTANLLHVCRAVC